MKLRVLTLAAMALVGGAQLAPAFAQTKVYVINEQRIQRESKVGKEMNAALGNIAVQGETQLGLPALKTELAAESARLKPQTQSLTPEAIAANPTLKAQVENLNKKATEYLQKQNALGANLEQRNDSFSMAFLEVLAPAVDAVAKEAGADVVISYSSSWYVKDAVDLSSKVVARLDATVPTLAALQAALKPPAAPGGGQ
jgi:Skp family chaperone for outer membrane proteins